MFKFGSGTLHIPKNNSCFFVRALPPRNNFFYARIFIYLGFCILDTTKAFWTLHRDSNPGLFVHTVCNNLSLLAGVWASEYIPRGTRFGPMQGEILSWGHVTEDSDRKYFWRVYDLTLPAEEIRIKFVVDGKDVRQANWMRYVLPSYLNTAQVQN